MQVRPIKPVRLNLIAVVCGEAESGLLVRHTHRGMTLFIKTGNLPPFLHDDPPLMDSTGFNCYRGALQIALNGGCFPFPVFLIYLLTIVFRF